VSLVSTATASGVVAMRRSRLHVRAAVKGLYLVDTPIMAILEADFDFGQRPLPSVMIGEMISDITMEHEKTQNTLRVTPIAEPAQRALAADARIMPSRPA
jgi:hypothetical protein